MAVWLEKGEDVYEIDHPVTTLGRDDINNINLSIDLVSRVHAVIYERDGKYFIRDLGSRNGTKVNGNIAEDTLLVEGDMVTAGFALTFKTGELPVLKDARKEQRSDEAYLRTTHSLPDSGSPEN